MRFRFHQAIAWLWPSPPAWRADRDFRSAHEWAQRVAEKKTTASLTAYEHARDRYDRIQAIIDGLDDKADRLLAYASSAAGLLGGGTALGAITFASPVQVAFALGPATLSLVYAAALALRARMPLSMPGPAGVRTLVETGAEEDAPSEARCRAIAASRLHAACVGTLPIVRWKAETLQRATKSLIAALGLLFVCPVGVGLLS